MALKPYFLYPADSPPAPYPDVRPPRDAPRIEFRTETEAVDHACEMLKAGQFVAAIERPDGSLIGPVQIAARCDPLAKSKTPTR